MGNRSTFGKTPEGLARLLAIGLQNLSPRQHAPPTASVGEFLEHSGGQIGHYRLLSTLGEGGMGVVYLAQQEHPIRRQVALKVIKPGMDSKRVLARFEAEQQALALMEHPHIARVYDAGLAPSGRPYFVMEYVKGIPITEHCDKYRLTIEQRLDLFLHVCAAVQHAHQKGIIHRDLKPSNILVVIQDQEMVPKVIDFGVARAISQPLTERTLYTEQGQLIGTPEYMSPEQADPSNQDIDTRTDVYSLGVVLYELLAGLLPFDPQTFRTGGIEHIRKVICEEDPKTPSTRLSRTSVEESTTCARRRQMDLRTLRRKLQGDLDWITLKAIEKDRTRRYPTVDAFATDLRRYLSHEPVSAAPPGVLYRAGKFARRHRQAMAAAGAVLLLLLVLLWAGQAYVRAGRERAHARQLEHERILSEARELFETRVTQGVPDPSSDALALIGPLLDSRYVKPQAEFLFASILVEDRRYEEAVPRLEKLCLLLDHPEIAGAAHALLARIIWESQSLDPQELKKVQEHQEKAEQLLPRTAEAYYMRAMTELTIHEKLDLLAEALRLDSSHYPSRRLRAFTYQASRKYELLKDDALLMMDRWPSNPLGYSLRATALRELGACEEAVKCYDTAITLTDKDDPQYIQLNIRRWETLMRIGQYERALSEARECLAVVSDTTLLHFHCFCALTALGRYEEARSAFQEAINSNPAARTKIRDWSMKYVFDMLEAGTAWHPAGSAPEGAVFLPFCAAEETHRILSTHACRLITDAFYGCWSPEGDKVVFNMGVYGYSGVAVYDMKTQKTDLLLVPAKDPSWSPDGRHIAFVRDCEALPLADFAAGERSNQRRVMQDEELWVMSADATEPRCLARGARWPSWSSDASHIYYQSLTDHMLCSIAIDGNEAEPVPVLASSATSPSISPGGDQVAYVQNGWLRITDIVSQSDIAEWAVPMPIWGGNWSPDGREFAFGGSFGTPEARTGFWIYELDKEEARNVLAGQITAVSWSRDKTRLLLSLGPPYFEIWVADIDPRLPTAESLGPVRTKEETLLDLIDTASQKLEVDPNQLAEHWARAAAALWIGDDRAPRYIQEMGRAIDRQPGMIDTCWWWAKNTIARPAVNNRVLPLTLMMARKAVEQRPAYTRDFALTLHRLGQYEEAAHFWQISEANAPDGRCQYDRASDRYTIEGYGVDIWETLDDFHYAYKRLNGDGTITARIESIENVNEWSKAGVMIRSTLEPDSPNAMLLVTPSGRLSFQYRSTEGAATHDISTPPRTIQIPHWLRLVRQGNRFGAQHSDDSAVWQNVLDASDQPVMVEIPMDKTVSIGLAVTSHDVTKTTEARISHITTTGNVSPAGPFTVSQDIPSQLPFVLHEQDNGN
jgi:serine/threonine protein kinase